MNERMSETAKRRLPGVAPSPLRPLAVSFLFAFATFQTLETTAAEVSNHWKRLPDLPDPIGVAGAFAGVSGNGELLVAGGANFPDAPPWDGGKKIWHDTIWSLEKPDGEWKKVGKLPKPNGYGVSVTTAGGLVCIGGGDANENFTDVFLLYQPEESETAKLERPREQALPSPVANACGVKVGRDLYVAGGIESPTSTVALSSFSKLSYWGKGLPWQNLKTWPGPARQLATAGAIGDAFYLVGGVSLAPDAEGKPVRTYLRDAYVYYGGWKRIADLPFPLAASPSPAATVNGKLVIFGGDDAPSAAPKTHKGFRDEMLEYDPATDKWTVIGRVPASRVTAPVVFWNGGYVIVSGEIRRGVRSREVWMWTP